MKKPIIEFKNVSKVFEDSNTKVLKDINFELEEGKFYTLLGASGSGKSTILNIIAGLLDATTGDILLDGVRINDIPTNKRDVHTVFQSYALFPHMNVFENVAFPLRLRKIDKKEIEKRVAEVLKMVQLEGYEKRSIRKLSGGQRQRVAIARAIINQPRVVLLDEPLSALDLKLRTDMQYELRELQQRLGITFVFVTHDQEEALSVSDRIAVMSKGEVLQIGTPNEIYEMPANGFVADFIGETNFIEGKVIEVHDKYGYAENDEIGRFKIELDKPVKVGDNVKLTLRPEKIKVDTEPRYTDNDNYKVIKGTVDEVIYTGFQSKLFIKVDGMNKLIKVYDQHRNFLTEEELFEWKEKVYFYWHYEDAYLVEVN